RRRDRRLRAIDRGRHAVAWRGGRKAGRERFDYDVARLRRNPVRTPGPELCYNYSRFGGVIHAPVARWEAASRNHRPYAPYLARGPRGQAGYAEMSELRNDRFLPEALLCRVRET